MRVSFRSVAVLGSTGSIGTQALEVIAAHPDAFRVTALAAGGAQPELLAHQVATFHPKTVAVAVSDGAPRLRQALAALGLPTAQQPEIIAGPDAAAEAAAGGADVVLNGITGGVGLAPTLAALKAGSTLALANKESLVVGGALVKAAQQRDDQIVPVDSEHSALAQCLRGGRRQEAERLILTASGGPFRGRTRQDLANVTPQQALNHPTWAMGPVVTVNSSTLVNKALELIEAHLLFGFPPDRIDVVVHPQSMIHSMVAFRDGAILAQVSPPDMRLPIALGLSWPDRLPGVTPLAGFSQPTAWTFEPVDNQTFPAIELARYAIAASPLHPAVLNAANEVLVEAFLNGRLPYLAIGDTLNAVVRGFASTVLPGATPTLGDVMAAQAWGRDKATEATEATGAASAAAETATQGAAA
ncbi:MAG: 1-deoxy-D-xylulose-5-phosphate reductoisomerase [Bifidobacteriaceae bacterium]|jgi:1-deoxy-D-xylulose-5-phosphate reductoisomerase|nr:1-deoxy-D-xylulose-5-phosphate reductoisomerase [Bifidobacteriaceae bacterium]